MTSAETRLTIPRSRVVLGAVVHRVKLTRLFITVTLAVGFAGFTVLKVHTMTRLFLSPDGAHYIADADSLVGNGARGLRHPPLFPALVALVRPLSGEPNSFLWAMAISMSLLAGSLYVLLRRWLPFAASVLGAAAGCLLPIVAELFGWGGGATLLGTVMLVFTLAAMEAWVQQGGRRGFLVGACLGATALTHAFPFGVATIAIAVRTLVLLLDRRRLGSGWDPLGWKGIASVVAVSAPALVLAYPFYFGPAVSLGGFQLGLAWGYLRWAFGDGLGVWLLGATAVAATLLTRHRGLIVFALSLAVVVVVFPTVVEADSTYTNRVVYLLPIILALGVGAFLELIEHGLAHLGWPWFRPLTIAGTSALFLMLAFTTYLPRLQRAVNYYNVWITSRDLPILQSLRDGDGAVATSWRANDYSDGVNLSWYVEGLAKRPAYGPGDSFLASIPEQFQGGLDMQRVLAGMRGLENGSMQVVAAPLGSKADLSLQVNAAGFKYPFLFIRSLSASYPVDAVSAVSRIDGSRLLWTFRDSRGRPVMTRTAWLDGDTLNLRYALLGMSRRGDWAVAIRPIAPIGSYVTRFGGGSSGQSASRSSVQGTEVVQGELLPFIISARGATVARRIDGPDQSIEIRAEDRSTLQVQIRVDGPTIPGDVSTFEEGYLLQEHDITDVLVLRNTHWLRRFDLDPCYSRVDENRRMVVYRVLQAACGEE
jgi:hypothetical protein